MLNTSIGGHCSPWKIPISLSDTEVHNNNAPQKYPNTCVHSSVFCEKLSPFLKEVNICYYVIFGSLVFKTNEHIVKQKHNMRFIFWIFDKI